MVDHADGIAGPASFHEGERAVQARVGVEAKMATIGPRAIRSFMPEQHREFFAQLPFLLLGAADARGQVWASVLAEPPGFITSPDPTRLHVASMTLAWDALAGALHVGQAVGLLGIEPHTRRRNRMNGVLSDVSREGFAVEVRQSFGNCPKYIQSRQARFVARTTPADVAVVCSTQLDATSRRIIERADTFYIASSHEPGSSGKDRIRGVDISHRGGKPGFVRVDNDGVLTAPDFFGNFFFNTLGNLLVNPSAGLLFIDFAHGDVVQLAVDAEIVWDGAEVSAFAGAERLVRFTIRQHRRATGVVPLRWGPAALSPYLEETGEWRTR